MSRLKTVPDWPYQIADPDWNNLFKNFGQEFRDALESAQYKCENESLVSVQDTSNKADGISYVSIKNTRKSYYREDAAFIYVSPSKKTKIGGVFDGHGHPAGYGLYAAVIGAELCEYACSQIQYDTWGNREDIIRNMNELFAQLDSKINVALMYLFHATIDKPYGIIYNNGGNLILGGTTCTIAISHMGISIKDREIISTPLTVISYVGDSDAYILHSGKLLKITEIEHTPDKDPLPLKKGARSKWNVKNIQSKFGQPGVTMPTELNKTYLARSEELPRYKFGDVKIPDYKPGNLSVQMTRSLGDFFVPHSIEPTVYIADGLFCVIIASDGVWDLKDDKKYEFVDYFNNAVYTSHFDSTEIINKLNTHVTGLMANPKNKYDDMTLLTIGDILPHIVEERTITQLLAMDPSELSKKLLEFRLYSINSVAPAAAAPAAAVASSPNQNPFAPQKGGNRRKIHNRKSHKARTAAKSHKIRHNKTRTKSRR